MVGENQSSSPPSAGKQHVKPPRIESDSQTIETISVQEHLNEFSIIDIFLLTSPAGCEPARE